MMNMRHKNAQVAISLLAICALFCAPVWGQPCETTEALEEACCCCPCCQETDSSLAETGGEGDDCPCEMSEADESEGSPAVILSNRSGGVEILLVASSARGETDDYRSSSITQLFSSLFLPSRDQPLYILHSSFLI
jgi:hypothetical protein